MSIREKTPRPVICQWETLDSLRRSSPERGESGERNVSASLLNLPMRTRIDGWNNRTTLRAFFTSVELAKLELCLSLVVTLVTTPAGEVTGS